MRTYQTDALNREHFGDLLFALLQSEFILADESFVVALTGGFGSGKSHFLEMWEQKIRCEENGPQVVHINAWESDHSGEPVLAIVSAISKQLKAANTPGKNAMATLKSAAGRIALGAVSLTKQAALGYLEAQTGLSWESTVEAIEEGSGKAGMNKVALSLFSEHEARSKAIEDLRRALEDLIVGSDELKLILVVDELDRCRPTYAIDFLESLKHFFNIKGLAVLMAVDWEQLSCTARALFGADLDPKEYFRKFFTRRVSLPDPGVIEINQLIEKFWMRLVQSESLRERGRFTVAPDIRRLKNVPSAIFLGLGVARPRQIEEVFRILSYYFHAKSDRVADIDQIRLITIITLASISVNHPLLLSQIADGSASVDHCLEIVYNITRRSSNDIEWNQDYIESILVDAFVSEGNKEEFKTKFTAGLSQEQVARKRDVRTGLPSFACPWGEGLMKIFAVEIKDLKSYSKG